MNFYEDLSFGESMERLILDELRNLLPKWNIDKIDHREFPFDLLAIDACGKKIRIEVKTHRNIKRYPTFYAETFRRQDGSSDIPEWMMDDSCDVIMHVDQVSQECFIFDAVKLRSWCRQRKHMSQSAKNGTSRGLKVKWDCLEAGFMVKFKF